MNTRAYLIASAMAAVLAGGTARAEMKDPLPDSLSLGGVTVYGTVDVGIAYQSAGVPLNATYPGGLEYQSFTTTRNFNGSQTTVAESAMEQSKIGIRVAQPIVDDYTLVAQAETGFNPLSGHLTDACQALVTNSGVGTPTNPAGQTANADSSRCGQAFNSVLFGGVGNKELGTLTIGRQNSLQLTALGTYDPQSLSYAFSFVGYSGFDGGGGSTEAARWNNSIKYAYQNTTFHAAAMYGNGGSDTGILGKSFAFDGGVTVGGLAVDFVYENEKGAVNLRSSFDNGSNPLSNATAPGLAAYISNDEAYNLMGKYTIDIGDGKVKDKLIFYGGYSHMQKSHGNYNAVGATSQGNYLLNVGININNDAVYNLEWLGVRYALASGWNFAGALYHATQNSWSIGLGSAGTENIGCSGAGLLCSGSFNEASVMADYVINKHYDVYGGINYSDVTDGLAWGFSSANGAGTTGSQAQTDVVLGFRVKF